MNFSKFSVRPCILFLGSIIAFLASCQQKPDVDKTTNVPPVITEQQFTGDYTGEQVSENGQKSPIAAQVIAYANNRYRVNILSQLHARDAGMAVLEGQLAGGMVNLKGDSTSGSEWQATLSGEKLSGKFSGTAAVRFQMQKTVNQSPSLGKPAPKGAVILFDGKNLDQWQHRPETTGYVNLAKRVGGDNQAAYLKTEIWSQSTRKSLLLLASDDGVKAWLNEDLIFENEVIRGAVPDQDKVPVSLKKGWNVLMLKISNGSGGWGAMARFTDLKGQPLKTIEEKVPGAGSAATTRKFLDANKQFLTRWQLAAPYSQIDFSLQELFDFPFAPESDPEYVEWQTVDMDSADYSAKWSLIDDAMEVKGGSGSIITKEKFGDFELHIEFRSPFMPDVTGQKRGNSGVYLQGRYEIQVLDSYGLEGKDNECGGIYKVAVPRVNMCAPPGQWQTYDIEFKAARYDKKGNKTANARLSARHNGISIHDNLAIPKATGGALDSDESQPGPIMLQDHGDRVQYRNIWLVRK